MNFPADLDNGTTLANTRATGNTIPASDHNDLANAIIELEKKTGKGASLPTTSGYVLTAGSGSSTGWAAPSTVSGATFSTAGTVRQAVYNVKDYSAQGDTLTLSNGAISSSTATLTATGAGFTSADVGKYISIAGAGASGATLTTTIASYISATSVTTTVNASTTVSGAQVIYGTDDTTAFNNAVSAMTTAGGGRIYVPSGVYTVGVTITILCSNFIFEGAGQSSILMMKSGGNTGVLTWGNAVTAYQNVLFRNFAIDGNKANQPTSGVGGDERQGLRLRCDAMNSYYATVDNVYVYNTKQNGISVESGPDTTIKNCRVTGCSGFGIWWENGFAVNISNNFTGQNTGGGIRVYSANDGAVVGNVSMSDDGFGLAFQNTNHITVAHNISYRSGWHSGVGDTAASGYAFSLSEGLSIIGNTSFASMGHGMYFNGVTYSFISGNVLRSNGQYTDNTYSDFYLDSGGGGLPVRYNSFVGNMFVNSTGAGRTNIAKYNVNAVQTDTHTGNTFRDNQFGAPTTAKTVNLNNTDGTPGVLHNTLGNNGGLNPGKYYSYGFLTPSPFTINWADGGYLIGTGYGAVTINVPDGIVRGQDFRFKFVQGSATVITWGSNIKWPGGVAPRLNATSNEYDIFRFTWDGTYWNGEIASKARVYANTASGEALSIISDSGANTDARWYKGSTRTAIVGSGGNGDIVSSALADSFTVRAENALHLAAGGDNLSVTVTSGKAMGVRITSPTSAHHVHGSLALKTDSITTNTTLDDTHNTVRCNATGGAITVTLPTASGCVGRIYRIKKSDVSANAITIATSSSQTIDGASTSTLASQYDKITVQSNGSNWDVL